MLGWVGAGPDLAIDGDVFAIVDGPLEDLHAGGSSLVDATGLIERYRRRSLAEALRGLSGDFALALFDGRTATLWLTRDRFGVRPMYFARARDGFAFASRPGPLLELDGVSRRADRGFVARFAGSHYRYFDNDPAASPFAHVRQLPAAHVLRVSANAASSASYWSLRDLPDRTDPAADLAEEYRSLLQDAVGRRLVRSRRPAFTLSGGMDSSSIAALAGAAGATVVAFSAIYPEPRYDESADITPMVHAVVDRWEPIVVDSPDVFGLVRRMVRAHDEPVATATWLAHFLLCERVAAMGHDALFGGLGGDELNAGEYEHFLYYFADLRASGDTAAFDHEVARWIEHHDHPIYGKSRDVVESELQRLVDPTRPGLCLPDRRRMLRYARALGPGLDLSLFEPVMDHPFASYLKNRCYQDIYRETIPCCLRAEDRHARAFGMGHFLPFYDHRLAQLMFRVPGRLKIRDGMTKWLLREAMRDVLPEATRTRVKKTGWNAPAYRWFAGAGRDRLLDLVGSRAFREREIYNVPEVLRIIAEHDEIVTKALPREDHAMFLWQLVNLEIWFSEMRVEI